MIAGNDSSSFIISAILFSRSPLYVVPLISLFTFNENIKASLHEEVSSDGQTITYTSDGTGYDNATYKLIIKIDTIQYDQANNIW